MCRWIRKKETQNSHFHTTDQSGLQIETSPGSFAALRSAAIHRGGGPTHTSTHARTRLSKKLSKQLFLLTTVVSYYKVCRPAESFLTWSERIVEGWQQRLGPLPLVTTTFTLSALYFFDTLSLLSINTF